jgi:hypothetical protein
MKKNHTKNMRKKDCTLDIGATSQQIFCPDFFLEYGQYMFVLQGYK